MTRIFFPLLCSLLGLTSAICHAAGDSPEPNCVQNRLTAEELAAGWILLFDGETLFGWKAASQTDWQVADGAIRAAEGEAGLLHTTTQFSDFELRCDFKSGPDTNSGIFLRTSPKPSGPTSGCYELNIASPLQSPFPTGSLVGRKKGAFSFADNQWHTYHVVARGGNFSVRLDGRPVLEWKDARPLGRGFIGLQKNEGPIAFRNIKLRPLGLASLFNGKDLTGWRSFPGKASRFAATPKGELQILGGPGQLETEKSFADFVLQAEIYVDGDALNSGIFFRSIPGDFSNGYESQIHNGFEQGDRNRPANAGTGAIFRRQDARLVNADDHTWFSKTIICEGPHMAVWVDGIQVTDWTDRRAARRRPGRLGTRAQEDSTIRVGTGFKITP